VTLRPADASAGRTVVRRTCGSSRPVRFPPPTLVLRSSAVSPLQPGDALSAVRAVLPTVGPQISGTAPIVDTLQPMLRAAGEIGRQAHVGLAPAPEALASRIPPTPDLAKIAGLAINPIIRVELPRSWQDVLAVGPRLVDLIGGHVADHITGFRSVADWSNWLEPSVLAEARYAFTAYMKGDTEPMKVLHRCLRLRPVQEDRCQALAVAMYEGAWEQEADLADDRSVRRILTRYGRRGCDSEYDHQIRGATVGYIPDGWEQQDPAPGQEDLVIPRLVPWVQQFEAESVRDVLDRLTEQERAVTRARTGEDGRPLRTSAPRTLARRLRRGEAEGGFGADACPARRSQRRWRPASHRASAGARTRRPGRGRWRRR